MTSPANRFARGSAVYACRCCKRNTRATGQNDNEHVRLCVDCFELAGYENQLSDYGTLSESDKETVRHHLGALVRKGITNLQDLFGELAKAAGVDAAHLGGK